MDGLIGGSSYNGNAELVWTRDGKNYQTQLLIRKFGLTLQAWTSEGALGERGRAFVQAHHTYPVLAQRFLQAIAGEGAAA